MKNAMKKIYLILMLFYLYAPILVLIVLSFNEARSRVVWGGFSLKWYADLFSNETVMNALRTTLVIASYRRLRQRCWGRLPVWAFTGCAKFRARWSWGSTISR